MRILITLLFIFTMSCANAVTQYGAPQPGSPGTHPTTAPANAARTSSTINTAGLDFMPQMTGKQVIKALFQKTGYKYFHKNKLLKLFTIPDGE